MGRCMVGGCVNLLSDNLHQRRVMLLLITSITASCLVLKHLRCSETGTGLGHEKVSVASCTASTHLIGHLSSSTVPGWHCVVVCLVLPFKDKLSTSGDSWNT